MITKIFIKKLDWFDIEAEEADVCFTLNGIDYWGFSQPCYLRENRFYTASIIPLMLESVSEEVFWNLNATSKDLKLCQDGLDRTRYLAYGKIVGISPTIINYGALEFEYGNWIKDTNAIGKYIYHVISRLDIDEA